MCLLVSQPEGTKWDDDFIEVVFERNGDGLGVMYAEGNTIYTAKVVPNTLEDFKEFFDERIQGKACAWHARMQTHGDIDLANCHPYEVLGGDYPLYLMHNGVLRTDNKEDTSKSDTWHYIRRFLVPMLEHQPEWFMSEDFAELIGKHIGLSNKFVLMDAYGNTVCINDKVFLKHNGAKLSNDYAWDTTGTEHDTMSRFRWFAGGPGLRNWGKAADDTDDDEYDEYGALPEGVWADFMFECFDDANMREAYMSIPYDQACEYYHAVGSAEAYRLADRVLEGGMTEAQVIHEVLTAHWVDTASTTTPCGPW